MPRSRPGGWRRRRGSPGSDARTSGGNTRPPSPQAPGDWSRGPGLDRGNVLDRKVSAMNILQQLEAEQAGKLAAQRAVPEFAPGDTVRVNVKVVEGTRERVQAYEGGCIARKNAGLTSRSEE